MLRSKIQEDLTSALKAGDQIRVSALRLLWSELRNEEINLHKELSDDDVIKLLRSYVKKINESAELFKKGNRNDLYEENKLQSEIFSAYLPAQLSDEELKKAIDQIVKDNNELYTKNPKAIIGIVMKQLASQADTKKILSILDSL